MTAPQPNNPLHGLTLEQILVQLVERLGWATLGRRVSIRCFNHEPSIASSLKFLRRTPWARAQVEALYLDTVQQPGAGGAGGQDPRAAKRNRPIRIFDSLCVDGFSRVSIMRGFPNATANRRNRKAADSFLAASRQIFKNLDNR